MAIDRFILDDFNKNNNNNKWLKILRGGEAIVYIGFSPDDEYSNLGIF